MSPAPAVPPDFDPEDILWFSYDWCGLPWTDWVPFNADRHTFGRIPHEPGLYRIRPKGQDFLMYIGETGRPLNQRINELRQNLRRADIMPWSDPHAEAPALWAYWSDWLSSQEEEKNMKCSSTVEGSSVQDTGKNPQVSSSSDWLSSQEEEKNMKCSSTVESSSAHEPGKNPQVSESVEPPSPNPEPPTEGPEPVMLEISAAPLDASRGGRKAMEHFLLYRYRQETEESPLCNFGRFHPRYRRSTTRKENRRGEKLAADQRDNPAGMPSITPLEPCGRPGDPDWMGLEWSEGKPLKEENFREVLPGAGLYLISDAGTGEVLYIGQSADCVQGLRDQGHKEWDGHEPWFSYQIIGQKVLPHHLNELQSDLLGNFFEQNRKAPGCQFR